MEWHHFLGHPVHWSRCYKIINHAAGVERGMPRSQCAFMLCKLWNIVEQGSYATQNGDEKAYK